MPPKGYIGSSAPVVELKKSVTFKFSIVIGNKQVVAEIPHYELETFINLLLKNETVSKFSYEKVVN